MALYQIKKVFRYIRRQFVLTKEESPEETYQDIVQGIQFKGYNLWVLCVAMIMASIGLNLDSQSAIIGAMIISPLMGPSVGFGYAVAVNDTYLKKKAVKNWLLMTVISLTAATVYFLLSPFDRNTSTLGKYNEATIFDIMIAFAGGIACLLGILKQEGFKVLAGVAVATSCMAPLCTASYGIAHWDSEYFLGGLYCYLINCGFMGLGVFVFARYLRLKKVELNAKESKTSRIFWQLAFFIMLIPGLWIAYEKWQKEHTIVARTYDENKIALSKLNHQIHLLDSVLFQLQTRVAMQDNDTLLMAARSILKTESSKNSILDSTFKILDSAVIAKEKSQAKKVDSIKKSSKKRNKK